MQKIKAFFLNIWYFFFPTDLMKFEKKLDKEAKKVVKQRQRVKKEILAYVRKNFGVKGNSKHIPYKGYNKEKILVGIYANFDDEMKAANLKVTKSLKFSA